MTDYYKLTAAQFIDYMEKKSDGYQYILPNMPDHIEVHVIYPSCRVAARVLFYEKGNKANRVSTYLDTIDALGSMGKPYFELYPNLNGDTTRYYPEEQEEMYKEVIACIDSRIKERNNG